MKTVELSKLRQLEKEKLISIQQHPTLPLLIHNYTQFCQFDRAWNDLTTMCRGLITDLEGNVVSRPFRKFFNLAEHEGEDSKLPPIDWRQPFVCTEKMDGSLGILYPTPDGPVLATRGSFTSDQAIRGTEIFRRKGYDKHPYAPEMTYLFEIIYPENRIVLDYGDMEDLVLLDVIETERGESVSYEMLKKIGERIGCPVVEYLPLSAETIQKLEESFGLTKGGEEEGVVVRFVSGQRVKVKYAEYCRLHKLITGVNARHIWEHLMLGQSLDDLVDKVPDEFMEWVQKTVAELKGAFEERRVHAMGVFAGIKERLGDANRKEFALEFVKHEGLTSILFQLLDGKDPSLLIWKALKPASISPFKHDEP